MTVAEQMTERLKLTIPIPVLLFPEGTSTDGSSILRFHSRLIDPATSIGAPITTACIRYVIDGGIEERELCWYGDDPFAPHLWKVLGVAGFHAEVQFGEPRVYPDRRTAADKTHDEIEVMRSKSVLAFQ
jgi:1-acyl-sn-glycerol-3-phosphate acyltransferase